MPVIGLSAIALDVPDLAQAIDFYTAAGLEAAPDGNRAYLRCKGRDRDCMLLLGEAPHKKLNHIRMRAEDLDGIAAKVGPSGGELMAAPAGMSAEGIWVRDPHGMVYHLREEADEPPLATAKPFGINAPGQTVRIRQPAQPRRSLSPAVLPLRLGHMVAFTPDVMRSVAFATEALELGLADHSGEVVAFCCTRRNSDHHVLGFGKSSGVGFHHASFMVNDPDEVGRAGRRLADATGRGDWGFGRHTIGSNFFHYIKDPWGSWFEYYSDMDYIDDYSQWTPSNYPLEDSLHHWGPNPPDDFNTNYEIEAAMQI
jgi:catechol 2,3-dioxygenase-like lactoylglutathione lyase family enzyme